MVKKWSNGGQASNPQDTARAAAGTDASFGRTRALDSVSQFALGASCAALALHGDSRPWRAVLVGGLVATLPDLDVLFSTGSPIADVRAHRGHSHSLLQHFLWQFRSDFLGFLYPA